MSERFVMAVREVLARSSLDTKCYAGHSFRIGAAMTAAQQGLQDSLIKMLGRWESSAYTRYIRTLPQTLCQVSKALTSHSKGHSSNFGCQSQKSVSHSC